MREMRNKSRRSTLEAVDMPLLGVKRCMEAQKVDQGVIREPGERRVSEPWEGEGSRSCIINLKN